MRYLCAAAALLSILPASSCGLFNYSLAGGPDIDDTVWLRPNGSESAGAGHSLGQDNGPNTAYVPPACATASSASGGDPYAGWKADQIKACTAAMRQLIDVRFSHYEDALLASNSVWNTVADLSVVGMGAAGGLIGGTTSQILNAASSAVTGSQGKINSDVLYSHSINLILQQMKSDRATQGKIIEDNLKATDDSGNGYQSMYQAAVDLYKYARAGSWTDAMLSLESNTGGAAQSNTKKETESRKLGAGQNPADSTNSSGG